MLLDVLEIGTVCFTLCRLLDFESLCSLSSLCRRAAANSHARIYCFARAELHVPPLVSEAELCQFVAGLSADVLPFIRALRLRAAKCMEQCGVFCIERISAMPSSTAWSRFHHLESLTLSHAFAPTLDPSIWAQPRLKRLSLVGSVCVSLAPVARLSALEHLCLDGSVVWNLDAVQLTSLVTLEMAACRFLDDSPPRIARFTNLRRLVLGEGSGGIMDHHTFDGFEALTELRHFQYIGQPTGRRVVNLPLRAPRLEFCNVSRTLLRDAEFLRFSPAIRYLGISETGLRAAAVPFSCLEQLEVLVMSQPEPRDHEHLAPLASLSALVRIEVAGCSASLESVRAVFPESVRPLVEIGAL